MQNPAEQFNMVRPDTSEEPDKQSVDHEKARTTKEEIDQLVNGRPLESLSQEELNKVLLYYEKMESALGLAEEKQENPTIEATTKEGEPITFNLETLLTESKDFYNSLNLPEWTNDLPEKIELTQEQITNIKELVEKYGFNKIQIFPSVETQNKTLAKLAKETTKPIDGLEESEQYAEEGIWMQDAVKEAFPNDIRSKNRPDGCYIQLYRDDPEVPDESRGKTYPEARQGQKEKGLNGYTLSEYLIFQKLFTKEFKKHPETTNWTWCTDSEIGDPASARAPDADWDSHARQVSVDSDDAGNHDDFVGVRSSAVVSLEL